MTQDEKIEIIQKAQKHLRQDTQDLDPEIRELVNENFADLLWK